MSAPAPVGSKTIGIDCAYDAASWRMFSYVARVAFTEAAREAGIYVDITQRPPPTGKLGPKWGKRKSVRRS